MPTALRDKEKLFIPTILPVSNGNSKIIFLQFLPSEKTALRRPLSLTIEYDSRHTIVSDAGLELFGYGDTEAEAIRDFSVSLEELYFWLKKNKKKLSKNLRLKYDFLASIISEK